MKIMNLYIDIGNTSIHWRLSDTLEKASPTVSVRHKNDWTKALATLRSTIGEVKIDKVVVASVAGEKARTSIELWSEDLFSTKPEFVNSQPECVGVTNAYESHEQLGVDRWLAVLAGFQYINRNDFSAALVVDAGTAMTLDAVLQDGTHLGGNIVAGLELQQKTLLQNTSEIKDSEGEENVWGKNTASAVSNGAQLALLGAITLAYEQLQLGQRDDARIHLLLSGGDAEILEQFFARRSGFSYSVHSNLVLDGLEVYLAS